MSGEGHRPNGLGLIPAILAGLALRRHVPARRSEPAHWPEAPRAGPGHETGDVDVARTARVMAGLAVCALVAVGLMLWLRHHVAADQRDGLPRLTAQQTARLRPPPPNLQADPFRDIARERAAEAERLDAYAYTDAARTRARIPIERAMSLTVGRSLDP